MSRLPVLAASLACVVPALVGAGDSAIARDDIGIAAAVNQQATRTPPSAATRTVVLGDTLIFRERVETRGEGLVQILLRDGSTFTVGANSDLVIDEFVYDPSAGSGRLVASFGKGVARFVGGKLSKSVGGVTVKTPVGTIGIRGGIANLSVAGNAGRFSLLFGDELSFTGPGGQRERIFERGYTLAVEAFSAASLRAVVRRTTADDISGVQRQLSGRPGQTGGTSNPPTEQAIGRSRIGQANSGRAVTNVAPRPKPHVVVSTNLDDRDRVLGEIASRANRDRIDNGGGDHPQGLAVRVLTSGSSYEPLDSGVVVTNPGAQELLGGSPATDRTIVFVPNGTLTEMTGTIDGETLTIPIPSGGQSVFSAVTSAARSVNGTVYRRGDDFIAFAYFPEISPSVLGFNNPVLGIWGTRTMAADVEMAASGNPEIRTYKLSADPLQATRLGVEHKLYFLNPAAADLLGAAFLSGVRTSDMLVIANQDVTLVDPRYLVASMGISGSGEDQKSAISVSTGLFSSDGEGGLQIKGSRRGSYRASAYDPSVLYAGPVSSIASSAGAHVFGPNGENFVIGYDPDTLDAGDDNSAVRPLPYLSEEASHGGYVHVGDYQYDTPTMEFFRSSRTLNGYAAGMMESKTTGGVPVPFWSQSADDLVLVTDASENSAGASIRVGDNFGHDPGLAGLVLGFGDSLLTSSVDGASAFIDNDRYALTHNRGETFAINDADDIIVPDQNPRSYMIPSTLVAGADTDLFAGTPRCTCSFLEWGYWGTRFRGEDETVTGSDSSRRDYIHLGTWAAGNVTTNAALPTAGTASYTGHAVGSVARQAVDGTARYLAAGSFAMTYDFASRVGSSSISGFDGRDFAGVVGGASGAPGDLNSFSGALNQTGGDVSGTLTGAFVGGPGGVAQGVVGSFGLENTSGTWSATGVIVGQQ
jgi:hypothetical protein